jgi:hypothetical protein
LNLYQEGFAMPRQIQHTPDAFSASSFLSAQPLEMKPGNRAELPQEVILPEQFFSPLTALKHGVGALLSAILTDAVTCFKKHGKATNPRARRLRRETEEWFFRNEPEWPFSFISICEALNLDPAYIRRGLQQWRKTPARYSAKGVGRIHRVGRRLKVSP